MLDGAITVIFVVLILIFIDYILRENYRETISMLLFLLIIILIVALMALGGFIK